MKIGVMTDSFRCPVDQALQAAVDVGANGVQMYAVSGELHPDNLTTRQRSDLKKRIADMGLEIAALCGDFGGHAFQIEVGNPQRIEDSQKVMDLALELGCTVVTTHIGVVPADPSHTRYAVMARACETLGRYGEQIGATFAIETGPEPAEVLGRFLDDIGCPDGMGVNFDPANLVMVCREDIPAAVARLGRYIVHTHAKDGRNLQPVDAEKLYKTFAGDKHEGFNPADYISEEPLGAGDVPWNDYIRALQEVGFDGYLTIEREVGDNPRADIAEAVTFLRTLLK